MVNPIDRLKEDMASGYDPDGFWLSMVKAHLMPEIDRLESELKTAVQYLREGKAQFMPHTTNSFVDDFITKHSGEVPKL